MTDFEKSLQEVRSILYSNPLVEEYFSLKKQIENNKQLAVLEREIAIHEKEMTKNMDNDEIYFKEKEIYESLKSKYDNDLLIINYSHIVEELSSLLNEVKEVLK